MYLSVSDDALGSMWAQEDETKNEHAIYYLSKKLKDYEVRYTNIERSCYALVWAIQKLRYILLAYQAQVVARMDPFKYLFENPILIGRLSRWLIPWAKFNLTYVTSKTNKGQAIARFYTHHPIEGKDLKQ